MLRRVGSFACGFVALVAASCGVHAQGTLRIAMTAGDIPTTTGMPNNGFEGMRFLGYPVFEGLILWDLSRADAPASLRPGLATAWKQDPKDPATWIFSLRRDVKFHDGTPFNADAFVWNMERYMNDKAKQFEPQAAGLTRARNPYVKSYRKIDDATVSVTTVRPLSYFPMLMVWPLMTSPTAWEKAGSWTEYAKAPQGTGPFKLARWTPRQSAELERNAAYWDKARVPKLDKIVLLPIPEANTRTAALRSGQVDWIEAPAPDAIPSLKQAGYVLSTNSYPHYWPWMLNNTKPPFNDVRVRQAINYCVDREAVVKLVGGTAEPSVGFFSAKHPNFGTPSQRYRYDPAKARQLLDAAGFPEGKRIPIKVMISTSGSGQMQPLTMNELLQQQVAACGFDVTFDVVEWGLVLNAWRNGAPSRESRGVDALNISSPSIDIATMARYLLSANGGPNGANWGHFKSEAYDRILNRIELTTEQSEIARGTTQAHQLIVDEAPDLFVVHDLNPVMFSKKVKGFVQAQSWFQDYVKVYMEK
ncbi:MAG: ABC transporter substrate-binding protein [Betaproteobacteria bacterium]|nr:ABC transporter substrate-binding protein [Betaproteobacteria bacterium]